MVVVVGLSPGPWLRRHPRHAHCDLSKDRLAERSTQRLPSRSGAVSYNSSLHCAKQYRWVMVTQMRDTLMRQLEIAWRFTSFHLEGLTTEE